MSYAQIDWRALCGELISLVERCPVTSDADWIAERNELIVQFHGARRAALAQPEPEVVGVTDEEMYELWDTECGGGDFQDCRRFARAVLARWGRAALSQPEPEGPTRRELLDLASAEIDGLNQLCLPDGSATDITDELEGFARAVLARWGRPAPVPAGEVEQDPMIPSCYTGYQIEAYRDGFHAGHRLAHARAADRASRLAPAPVGKRQAAPVPVPVSERWPTREDCGPDGAIWFRHTDKEGETHWLPDHALPLPSGEVEA